MVKVEDAQAQLLVEAMELAPLVMRTAFFVAAPLPELVMSTSLPPSLKLVRVELARGQWWELGGERGLLMGRRPARVAITKEAAPSRRVPRACARVRNSLVR